MQDLALSCPRCERGAVLSANCFVTQTLKTQRAIRTIENSFNTRDNSTLQSKSNWCYRQGISWTLFFLYLDSPWSTKYLSVISSVWRSPYTHTHSLFLLFSFLFFLALSAFSFHFLPVRVALLENVTTAILFYAGSPFHEWTRKLRKTCGDTIGHLRESVSSYSL